MNSFTKNRIVLFASAVMWFALGVLFTGIVEHVTEKPVVKKVRDKFNETKYVQDIVIEGKTYQGVCVIPNTLIFKHFPKQRITGLRMLTCDKGVLEWAIEMPKQLTVDNNDIIADEVMHF